jgi:hypothetical protein
MKKALVAAILGIALKATVAHGQGYIVMENYKVATGGTPVWSGVTYGSGSGPKTGQYVGAASGFKADLLYSLTGNPGTYSLAAGSQTSFFSGSVDGGTPTTDGAGSFLGGTITIPGYTSGPAFFIVEAYQGSSYAAAVSGNLYAGQSTAFSIPSLVTSTLQTPGDLLNLNGTTVQGLQPFVVTVPEPSIFALAGLGAAGLMAFRRKK